MGTIKQLSRIFSDDASLNRLQDQLASALNPILRNVQGDLSGPLESPLVVGLQNISISTVAPKVGQVLAYDGRQWTPSAASGGGVTAVTASAPLASSGGTTPNISLTGVINAAHGGTGLSSSGTDATKFLGSDGAGGWQLAVPAGGTPSGPAGGVLGYPGSTYPNPNGLASLTTSTPGQHVIPIKYESTSEFISFKPQTALGLFQTGQPVEYLAGDAGPSGVGGYARLQGGGGNNNAGGIVEVTGGLGSGSYPSYPGGDAYITGGLGGRNSYGGPGGNLYLLGGSGCLDNFLNVVQAGGDSYLRGGTGYSFATHGALYIGDASTKSVAIGNSSAPPALSWQGQTIDVTTVLPTTNQTLTYDGTKWKPMTPSAAAVPAVFISLSDNTASTAIPNGTELIASYDTVEDSNAMSLVSGTQIKASITGLYEISCSPQFTVSSGNQNIITLWLKKNGANVARSASRVELGNNLDEIFPFISFLIRLNANDYVEWALTGTDTNGNLTSYAASSPRPAVPALVASAKLIGS